ncbi:MAG TPA: branched-chain amino acid ABC transporter permease [Longimicrobiales bacterium]|nr:branched-chain amino acid ABC transporter permease [Longimicrobiales bacterium]
MSTAILAGLGTGSIYALIAIGYNITMTTANVLNFTFANIVMLGGFIGYAGVTAGLPIGVTFALAVLVCTITAVLVERLALRWLPEGAHAELVTTVGAASVITAITVLIWGHDPLRFQLFDNATVSLLGGRANPAGLVLIVLVALLAVVIGVIMKYTRIGLRARAHATDREAAMLRGVDVRWLAIGAFAAAGLVAGLAGPLVAATVNASPLIALTLAVKGFIAMTLGGVGSQIGALVGGLLIGVAEATTEFYAGVLYGDFIVFGLFIAALMFKPSGLFGAKIGRHV